MSGDKYPLVFVRWLDSCGANPHWHEVKKRDEINLLCESVGWKLCEDDEAVTVAPHRAMGVSENDSEHYCGDMVIPKCAIISIVEIEVPEVDGSGES